MQTKAQKMAALCDEVLRRNHERNEEDDVLFDEMYPNEANNEY
jgi:hypothetical protein